MSKKQVMSQGEFNVLIRKAIDHLEYCYCDHCSIRQLVLKIADHVERVMRRKGKRK